MVDAWSDIWSDIWGGATITPPAVAPDAVPRPVVWIGFTTDPTLNGGQYLHWSDPLRRWDQTLWAPDDVWADVTDHLQTWTFSTGATRFEGPVLRYEAGTATITLVDFDGRFNPLNLAGPYVSGGRTQVRPMVPVQIGINFDGATQWLWRGFADSWDITYPSLEHAVVTLTATDAQKVLSRHSRTALPAPVGAGELSGARVHRILNSVGWPAADRAIDPGEIALQGTVMDGDAWTELLLVQDTEVGSVYIDEYGRVVFKGRYAYLEEARSTTSQGIFGADRAGGELPYAALTPNYDDATIKNLVRITRAGGVTQEVSDAASIFDNLESTHERNDLLMQTDPEALYYAQYVLALSKDPELRFASLAVDPQAQPLDLFPQVIARRFGDRITIRSRRLGAALVERDVYIRGIQATYGGTNRWSWTWILQPANTKTYLVWDSTDWDSSVWSF